jgi:hypothetical protein
MPTDPLRLLSFCHALADSSHEGLLILDREDLLAVHKALAVFNDEIEQRLLHVHITDSPSR